MTVEQIAVEKLKAGLDAMAASRVIKRHYLTPKAIFQTPETPFAYFRLSADDEYTRDERIGGGTAGFRVTSRLLLTYAIRRESSYIAKELAEMNALMRAMVYEWVKDDGCNLQVTSMSTYSDPYMANLYDEYGAATLAINYTGIDDYTPSLEAEMSVFYQDMTLSSYTGAPASTILKTTAIPANILIDQKSLQFIASGRFAANGQSKTITLSLDLDPLGTVTDTTGLNNGGWIAEVKLSRLNASQLYAIVGLDFMNQTGTVMTNNHFPYIVDNQPPGTPFDFTVFGESPTNGNITANQLVVYLIG